MEPLTSAEGRQALEVVVCLHDSVVDVLHLRTSAQVRAGVEPGCRVALPPEALGGRTSVVLAARDGSGQALVGSLAGELRPLAPGEQVNLVHDAVRVLVRLVPDLAALPRPSPLPDRKMARVFAFSLLGHALFLAILTAIPDDANALSWVDQMKSPRLVRLQARPTEDPVREPEKGSADAPEAGGVASAPAPGPQGKMGRPETKTKGHTALKGERAEDRPGAGAPREWVKDRGVLGLVRAHDWSPITAGDDAWGSHDRWAYGSDRDHVPGDGAGSFGGGYDGSDVGGCPPGATHCIPGSIGASDGPGGRIGGGWCKGVDCGGYTAGDGPGGPRLTARGPKAPPVVEIKPPVVDRGLDREIVKRVVRSRLDSFKHCYERQLAVDHELGGTISVAFVIGPNGGVISAVREGSAGSSAVDGCVVDVVRGLEFPRSSTMTNVRYPFTFRAAGR
jgi:hypothetical protein